MDKTVIAAIVLAGILSGCSSSGSRIEEENARRHMNIAHALESQSHWNDAALEYALVAETYPATEDYPAAVRKAALLFSHPGNHAANDSTIMSWFSKYENLSLPEEERAIVESHIRTLELLASTRELLRAERARADSIETAQQRQLSDILARENRVNEMEAQLQRELAKTRQELKELREIDMNVGREKDEEK